MGNVLEFKRRANAPQPKPVEAPANASESLPPLPTDEEIDARLEAITEPHMVALTLDQSEAVFATLTFYAKQGWDGGKMAAAVLEAINTEGVAVLRKGMEND